MKKKSILLIALACLALLLVFCSCAQTQTTLTAPEGLTVKNGVLHWQSVNGAMSYIVMIDSVEQPKVTNTSYNLSNAELEIGQTYSIQIKAIGDSYIYLNSPYSEAISYTHTKTTNDNNNGGSTDSNVGDNNNQGGSSSNTSKPSDIFNVQTDEPDSISEFTKDSASLDGRIASSYWDGEYNYYLVYMGTVKTTPIATGLAGYYNGKNNATLTFTKETTEKESTTDVIRVIERELASIKASVEVGIGEFVKAGVEAYYETEKTTETASEVTKEIGESIGSGITYVVDSGEKGFYRISLYSFCDAYYVIKTNEARTELLDYSLTLCPRKEDCYTMLEYLGDTDDKKTYDVEKDQIENPTNFFRSLPEPKNDMVNMKNEDLTPNTGVSSTATITDYGSYGMGCPEASKTVLNMSKYKNLFKKEFMFRFTVTVQIAEKDDGYQEIYLYNQKNDPTSTDYKIHTLQNEKGLLAGAVIEHTPSSKDTSNTPYTITWYVSGDKVKETMYIVYDAHGQRGDSWNRGNVDVTLDIVGGTSTKQVGNILSNSSTLEVTDSGEYGNNTARSKNTIGIDSEYYDCKKSNYVFMFDMSISMREKDDGYQEVYLYNSIPAGSIGSVKEAIDKGMLGAMEFCHTPGSKNANKGTYEFQWCITGDQIPEDNILYIAYDANGGYGDTWYRDEIKGDLYIYAFDDAPAKNSENVQLFYFVN